MQSTAPEVEVSPAIQAANVMIFHTLVAEQIVAAKSFMAQLISETGIEELRKHVATPVSELSDDFLDNVRQSFMLNGGAPTYSFKRQAYASSLSQARFDFVASLAGLVGDRAALLAQDVWASITRHGISLAEARAANNTLWQAVMADEELEEFLASCSRELSARAQREADSWLQVSGERCAVVATAPVYWTGWECDSTAWVVEKNGKRILITTNHGSQVEGDVELLRSKLLEYASAIAATQALLAQMGESATAED